MEIRYTKNGSSYSGEKLEKLVNDLNRYQETFGQAVKNNIPSDILNALVRLRLDRENFKTLEGVIKIIRDVVQEVADQENQEKYGFNQKHLNLPIHFQNGGDITQNQKQILKRYGVELDKETKEARAIVDHKYEKINLNKDLKSIQLTVDHDPENKLFKIIISGISQGREFKINFNTEFIESILIQKLFEIYEPIRKADEPPFKLVYNGHEQQAKSKGELLQAILEAGKKGLYIQRYKGLGEMNPDQLWETTMNPEKRVLFRIRSDDRYEATKVFEDLMGDEVEPRREFIQSNALEAKNLDV